ncbi:MAG: D-glycero-alpha-D-manno-heptose-1,7-bisphosphate 7-phosphatase [Phycisphaerales bacterium]
MPRPAVFLDRDDTVCRNGDLPDAAWGHRRPGDLLDPAYMQLLPGARESLVRLRTKGFAIIVITNQGGIARGGGNIEDIDACHDALRALLPLEHADNSLAPHPVAHTLIDACYSAPHHPTGSVKRFADEHPWRKPGPGMVQSAARELGLDLANSWMVGDKQRDLDSAVAAGVDPTLTIQVKADGIDTNPSASPTLNKPGAIVPDLESAVDYIEQTLAPKLPIQAERVTLRAMESRSLIDPRTRDTIAAAARGIAERTGIRLLELDVNDHSVTASIATHRLAAVAFLNELRRTINTWHTRTHNAPLFPEREA